MSSSNHPSQEHHRSSRQRRHSYGSHQSVRWRVRYILRRHQRQCRRSPRNVASRGNIVMNRVAWVMVCSSAWERLLSVSGVSLVFMGSRVSQLSVLPCTSPTLRSIARCVIVLLHTVPFTCHTIARRHCCCFFLVLLIPASFLSASSRWSIQGAFGGLATFGSQCHATCDTGLSRVASHGDGHYICQPDGTCLEGLGLFFCTSLTTA